MAATFSIITITYNAEEELPATLASVAEQTCTDYEYLVVDGASSDGTVALAQRSGIEGIRIVSERDGGLYDAMNKGIALATGKYLIFMNAGEIKTAASIVKNINTPSKTANSKEPRIILV